MIKNQELLERVKKLKEWKKGKTFIARELDITEEEVTKLVTELKALESENYDSSVSEIEDRVTKINAEKGTLESEVVSSFEPKSPEELAELHRVDTTKYKISSYWTKQRGEKFTSSLLCTLIKPSEFNPESFKEFLKDYKSSYKHPKREKWYWDGVDVEISLADFHIDKLDIGGETITDRKEQYKRILTNLVSKVTASYNINKLVFTLGNDFFQTDTYNNTTTKGTPVDHSTDWSSAYEEGFDIMVWALQYLYEHCVLLEVILVAGNHDRTKSYYLAHALEAYFGTHDDLVFRRDESPTKHTMLGNTFVGYHHGNCKIDDLPLIFATSPDSSSAFGNAAFREVRTGDKHYYMTKEIKGVRIQQLPSLAGTDRWHRDMNFINNLRAALALVYHPLKGKTAEFEERI